MPRRKPHRIRGPRYPAPDAPRPPQDSSLPRWLALAAALVALLSHIVDLLKQLRGLVHL